MTDPDRHSTYARSGLGSARFAASTSTLRDAEGPGWSLSASSAAVVYLSNARRLWISEAASRGQRPLLLTSNDTVLTPALHQFLGELGGYWIVKTEHGLREAGMGFRLSTPQDLGTSPEAVSEGAPEHADFGIPDADISARLHLSVSRRHVNPGQARFGHGLQQALDDVLEQPILEWGRSEPITLPWVGDDVTHYLRRGSIKGDTFVLFQARDDSDRVVSGRIMVRPTDRGAEEIIDVEIDTGPVADESYVWSEAATALAHFTHEGYVLMGTATLGAGHPGLMRWPWLALPSYPLALVIGQSPLRQLHALKRRTLIDEQFATQWSGPTRRESLIVDLADAPGPGGAEELKRFLPVLGGHDLQQFLPESQLAMLYGPDWATTLDELHREFLEIDAVDHASEDSAETDGAPNAL